MEMMFLKISFFCFLKLKFKGGWGDIKKLEFIWMVFKGRKIKEYFV